MIVLLFINVLIGDPIVAVTYINVDIHSTCLTMKLTCLKSPLLCALYTNLLHLTTNLFVYVLFCVFPVCYDVLLSHLNKNYLLAYLLIRIVGCDEVRSQYYQLAEIGVPSSEG